MLAPCSFESNEVGTNFWSAHLNENLTDEELIDVLREYLLDDFDFLVNQIVTYSPHINVINRRMGIDLDERFESTRNIISNFPLFTQSSQGFTQDEIARVVAENFLNVHLNPTLRPISLAHILAFDRCHMQE